MRSQLGVLALAIQACMVSFASGQQIQPIEVCNRLIAPELFNQTRKYEVKSGALLTRKDVCEAVEEAKKTGGEVKLELVGALSAQDSSKKARSICSSEMTDWKSENVLQLYQREFPPELLKAYQTCAKRLENNRDITIENFELAWQPSKITVPGQKVLPTDHAHYTFRIDFSWTPRRENAETKARISNVKGTWINCESSLGIEENKDPFHKSVKLRSRVSKYVECAVVQSTTTSFITISLAEAGPIPLTFAEKTSP